VFLKSQLSTLFLDLSLQFLYLFIKLIRVLILEDLLEIFIEFLVDISLFKVYLFFANLDSLSCVDVVRSIAQ